MKLYFAGALTLALLVACGETRDAADTEATTAAATTSAMADDPTADAAAPTDAAGYLAKAGAGDLFEIESSRAILTKSPDKAVADFADMMIEAHTASTAKLKAAAGEAGLEVPPPALEPAQQAKLDAIKAASGDAAAAAYLSAQREAHPAALALHRGYAAGGDTPALKTAAGQVVPVVDSHIEMLAKLPGA